jgi:uncharacterized OB-fold protein
VSTETPQLPEINSDTEPWWNATRERRLVLQHCRTSGHLQHYPRSLCVECGSTDLDYVDASGRGTVYSHTTVHRAPVAGLEVPYVVALVRLDEGPVLLTNIVDCPPDDVRCDMSVEVAWRPLADGRNLPVFRPVRR